MDRFKPVGLTLAIIAMDDVQARSPKDFAAEISKVFYFDKIQDHHVILAYVLRSHGFCSRLHKKESALPKQERALFNNRSSLCV